MAVTTWTFDDGFDGWIFTDESTGGGSATRLHGVGEIENNLILIAAINTAAAVNETSDNLNVPILNGDTIEVDYSASSDSLVVQNIVTAFYTDATSESNNVVNVPAGTLTLTMTQNKTLDYIRIEYRIGTSSGTPRNTTRDIIEVRLTTATEPVVPGKLRTPSSFIEGQGDDAAGGAGGGAGGNIADISADGLYIYIATFNNLGFPQIIKIATSLISDGTVVFSPGTGGRIGVQCANFNADHVWTAGQFGGTDTVEKSENAGSSFAVKDDGSFGTIRSFEVGPDSDNRIMLFDGDNGDLIQSTDGGATWTTINAAVSPLVNSIARFSQDADEIVLGNQGDVTDSINYSPNAGVNLEDYQTGVYPNEDATKVIVNP